MTCLPVVYEAPFTTVMLCGHIKYEEKNDRWYAKDDPYASGGRDVMLTNIGKNYSRDPPIMPA